MVITVKDSSFKRLFSLILLIAFIIGMFSVPSAAKTADVLPENTVYVSPTLTGASGETVSFDFGGKTYSAKVGEGAFSSVNDAVKALTAGGTLWLGEGTYSESPIIDRDITILGPKAGIDPNVKGKGPTDDWTRNPLRGSGEATITNSWHMGIFSASNTVYDCHRITVDGVAISGAGMFRSNYGDEGEITLNYRNILVSGYTTASNSPFYCYSYYPNQSTNKYLRHVKAENIRFEGHKAFGFNLTVEDFEASGIYFDANSTGKCIGYVTSADTSVSTGAVTVTIKDSMFRQKASQILNFNFKSNAGSANFNANIGKRESVTATVTGCVFVNCHTGAASNNNIIVPQISSDNIFFNISNNIFMQTETAKDNFIAIHGSTSALALGEKFVISKNVFVGIPTALSMSSSTTEFDLSGNYFALSDGNPQKPIVNGKDKTSWWYIDVAMTRTSKDLEDKLDGVPQGGTVDTSKKTVSDSVTGSSYTFSIKTDAYNVLRVYADKALTKQLGTTVDLTKNENIFYLKISSMTGEKNVVYEAKIITSNPDTMLYDLGHEVHFFGRCYSESGAYFFNWSASGFSVRFRGSGVSAVIESNAPGGSNTAYIKIYVDGEEMDDVALSSTSQKITLASGLDPAKEHTVRVLKRTNARSSSAAVTEIRLLDGEKLSPEENSERLIEFIGDSLTVGYVASKSASSATAWSTFTEDVTRTYVKQIADAFGADYNVVAISGRGVVRNTGGDTDKLLPDIYGKLDEYNNPGVDYDFARQPDVIVINLGTNDASSSNASLTKAEFKAGLIKFLKDVRNKNPKAEIIYAYGLTSTKYSDQMREAVSELRTEGDAHINFIELRTCAPSEKMVGHPIASAYTSRGETLISAIKEITGWKDENVTESTPQDSETSEPSDVTSEPVESNTENPEETSNAGSNVPEDSEKRGCGSSVCGATTIALTLSGAAVALKKRRKED